MKESLKRILRSKKFVISDFLIKIAYEKKLSLNEFLVLIYLENDFSDHFEIELISNNLGISVNDAMEAFNSLTLKGLVSLDSVKGADRRFNEVVNLNNVYDVALEELSNEAQKEQKEDIFKVFERELGRTISSMELELINGWLVSGTSEEMILGALREAVYNGVSNFRYIDKIIYEWEKKGFKTMDDVNNHLKNRYQGKDKPQAKANLKNKQDILDYDWLDE